MIALADPGSVWRADHCQHLIAGQVTKHRSLEALHRNPEGALNDLQRRHVPVGSEFQKRPQCRQTGIAATHGIVSLAFQVVEEGHDQIRRDIGQCHRGRGLPKAGLGKSEEQHERIAVGSDCLRTQGPVLRQLFGEVGTLESGLTPRELERKFSESETEKKVKRSCVWNKYRRGEVAPRSGPRPDGGLNLVDRVEAFYPGTAKWLTLPLWRLLDKAPMEISEIRRYLEGLPNLMRQIFIYGPAQPSGLFWRRDTDYDDACDHLLRFGNLDGLTAVLALVKEAEFIQDQCASFELDDTYSPVKLGQYVTNQLVIRRLLEQVYTAWRYVAARSSPNHEAQHV